MARPVPAALVSFLCLLLLSCSSPPSRPRPAARALPRPPAVSSESAVDPVLALGVLPPPPAPPADPADLARAREMGWGWMVDKLAADGISQARAAEAFA